MMRSEFGDDGVNCPQYIGVTCVNGSCPNALAEAYPEYDYERCSCEECGYRRGCSDCALAYTEYCQGGETKDEHA